MGHVLTNKRLIYRDTAMSVTVPCTFTVAVTLAIQLDISAFS